MALNSNYISFQPLVESVYRRAGYQKIDWAEAMEIIGETIRLIGALPAYKNVTTNGYNNNPNPLEISDYRVLLPSDFVFLEGIRKINLSEDSESNLSITSFDPMYESNNIFYKTTKDNWEDSIPAGTYDYEEFKHVNILTLSGSSGSATIEGPLTRTISFNSDLETTAANFVVLYAGSYLTEDIVLNSDGDDLIFKSVTSGTDFTNVTIENASGDLTGIVQVGTATDPIIVESPTYRYPKEYIYEFKLDNGYIYTNFEEGFIELSYKAFVTDIHGFPMIPDDERYINAVKWSIIEQLDYKKWRTAQISDKVYAKSEQERLFYIASAKSKSDIPTTQKMESLKNMFLRSISKTDFYDNYFKYSNIPEKQYN